MRQKIFAIMGATGHIGHVIVEELLKRGHIVRALGRDEKKLRALEQKGAQGIVCSHDDEDALTKAFTDAYAVFSFLPPSNREKHFEEYRDRVSVAICHALQNAKCTRVVDLSSVGADEADGTGPIKSLHRHEERLKSLEMLQVCVFLRPGFFMENLEQFLPSIEQLGVIRSPLKKDLPINMCATRDIGWKAADLLDSTAPLGKIVFDFEGPGDITMEYVTELFAEYLDLPNLRYEEISFEDAREEMIGRGMHPEVVDLLLEMYDGFNSGFIQSPSGVKMTHRGTTTIEEFIQMLVHRMYVHSH